jgi:hypothetical protein
MQTLARALYLDSEFGVEQELPHAGSALENPFVFDSAARELMAMASEGLVEIVNQGTTRRADQSLIGELHFKRLR